MNSSVGQFEGIQVQDQRIVWRWLRSVENQILKALLSVGIGTVGLAVLAQVAIPLPWTPVPITGQTFGVALIALIWGKRLGLAVIGSYLACASVGLPVLAGAQSGLLLGPTFGYLVGMVAAIWVVGGMVESGFAKGFWRSLVSVYVGSFLIFSFGLLGLSFFIEGQSLLAAGLYPFLLGDFIKNILAVGIYCSAHSKTKLS